MSREELELLAASKQTTPEILMRLMDDQAWFERAFVGVDPATGSDRTVYWVLNEPGQDE